MLSETRGVLYLLLPVFLLLSPTSNSHAQTVPDPALVPQACFAPGTPASVVEAQATRRTWQILTSLQDSGSSRHQFSDGNRWARTATDGSGLGQGDPTTLTWSLVPDGTSIPGYGGEATSASNLRAFLNATYGGQASWMPILRSVFDRWAEVTGLHYVYESSDDGASFPTSEGILGVRGDVRLSGHLIDGTAGILAYNFYPNLGDMVLDTADAVLQNTNNGSLTLRNVLAHEHGHGIGIPHVCPVNRTKLMEPYLTTSFDGPQHDDIVAANRGYGDRYEDADTPGTAASLGAAPSMLELADLSADDPGEPDYFSFTVGSSDSVTVTVAPIGDSYLNGAQNNGTCSQGTLIDTSSIQDLSVEILDRDGTTVLASVNDHGPGLSETLNNVGLDSGPGTYFALVQGSGGDDAQLYRLEVDVNAVGPSEQFTLGVNLAGDGNGRVVSSPAGIDCGSDCTQTYQDGAAVTLTASADPGSVFSNWSGHADCTDGQLTMVAARSCTATFDLSSPDPDPEFTLSVSIKGNGSGSVTSAPAGIDCGSHCSHAFTSGTRVTLAPQANPGSVFKRFRGDGDCNDGVVTMTSAVSCTAQFARSRRVRTKISGQGGRVVSAPAGIDCRDDCYADFEQGVQVDLVAVPDPGWELVEWRGHPDCRAGRLEASSDRNCHAVFVRVGTESDLVFEDSFESQGTNWWSEAVQ